MPVNTMAMPWASAASITSLSRIEPPGWITAVAPASIVAIRPSAAIWLRQSTRGFLPLRRRTIARTPLV